MSIEKIDLDEPFKTPYGIITPREGWFFNVNNDDYELSGFDFDGEGRFPEENIIPALLYFLQHKMMEDNVALGFHKYFREQEKAISNEI